jgi:predicted O-methyltransferase YrrM
MIKIKIKSFRKILYLLLFNNNIKLMIKPVILCIAKFEQDYIEEFVRYHLHLGFDKIYLYDNEDVPTYGQILRKFGDYVVVIHLPGKAYSRAPQYEAINRFTTTYMKNSDITHVCHIDIDEFIVLKKHKNITEFIKEYIYDGENNIMCGGICMNWRYFGSSNITENTKEPITQRFTKCEEKGNLHVKSIFHKKFYDCLHTPHNPAMNNNNYPMKSTTGKIINGPFNEDIDLSVIQVNHYKSKTLEEFKYIRSRGRADFQVSPEEDIVANFKLYNINEVEDFDAYNFYKSVLNSTTMDKFEKSKLGTLDSYLTYSGLNVNTFEGHVKQVPNQANILSSYSEKNNVKTVLEIGFNAGHSSDVFLKSNENVTVTSFDIGTHNYVIYGKSYIDQTYSFRHKLIIGDSMKTLPNFITNSIDTKYDIIFIDGSYSYDVSYSDLVNCKSLAHKDTIVIMDDVTNAGNETYNKGPSKAWKDAIAQKIILEDDHFEFNQWRGMSVGKYII